METNRRNSPAINFTNRKNTQTLEFIKTGSDVVIILFFSNRAQGSEQVCNRKIFDSSFTFYIENVLNHKIEKTPKLWNLLKPETTFFYRAQGLEQFCY
jgi:hypothetical protein